MTTFFEKEMGLSFRPIHLVWMFEKFSANLHGSLKSFARLFLFGKYTPVVVASTGRAGSTMLAISIARSLIQARCSFLPAFLRSVLVNLSISYCDRLEDIDLINRSPVIKTHDLYLSDFTHEVKYIFVYGDALDSAISAARQGELLGSAWLDEHIYHLCGQGSPGHILTADVLNYEGQLNAWQQSPAFIICYSEIWERRGELSTYLGFPLVLPPELTRLRKGVPLAAQINKNLFYSLKLDEKRFSAKAPLPPIRNKIERQDA